MGYSEKPQVEESDNKKWVIHGIALRASLKPIYTIPLEKEEREEGDTEEECSTTTPTGEEARVQKTLTCPPAPKKRKSSLKCNYHGGRAREFFTPPDLETFLYAKLKGASDLRSGK